MGEPARRKRKLRLVALAVVVVLVLLAAAWQWTPLHEYAEPRVVAQWLRRLASSSWLPLVIAGIFIVGNAVMFPNTVLCFATILALGNWHGFLYATGGSLLAAVVTYFAARRYAPDRIQALRLPSVERIGTALRRGGILSITSLRLLPLAPFAVVNIMAGIARVRLVPYVVGTLLGLLPGNLLFTAFGRQMRRMLQNPTPEDLAAMAAVMLVGSVAMWWLHRLATPARR